MKRTHPQPLDQAEREKLQKLARERLVKTFELYGLRAKQHFDPRCDFVPSVKVDCRLERAQADRQFIYAVLDDQGCHPDRKRLSRINAHYDVLRLVHEETGTLLPLIIKVPQGTVYHWEAA